MHTAHGSHWLDRDDRGDLTVVRLKTPRLMDDETTAEIFRQIYSRVDDMHRHRLVLNLQSVLYLASLPLGKLIMLNRKAETAGGRLALCGLSPTVSEILQVTGLADRFSVYAGEVEAVASFGLTAP